MRHFKTSEGSHVIVFPNARYPVEAFVPENWGSAHGVGRSRTVRFFDKLADGQLIQDKGGVERGVYVKDPERDFLAIPDAVRSGAYWYGQHGYRSGFKGVGVSGSQVERRLDLEAKTLLYLLDHGLRVEEPQALIIQPDGRKLLVTHEVGRKSPMYGTSDPQFVSRTERLLSELGIDIPDFKPHNMRDDDEGNPHVIDVFRASHASPSPLAKAYARNQSRLIKGILGAIKDKWALE
ncbi:hypothetical protein AUJ14_00160 [Candidatus Micrarchaeota archaeon CG1_02_55_22]|nr:MAG: hypothetical protein AUJ14_00160 [Candidatus Micrarchaeota archaeon CG1_02_55_22]